MSERSPVRLAMYIKHRTPKAILVCDDKDPDDEEPAIAVWLPLSMCEHLSIRHVVGERDHVTLKLPQWLVEKHNLWEFEV